MTARIVLVEDDPDIGALVREVLTDDGHEVDLRDSLGDGAPDPSVDLVITDLVVLRAYDPAAARGWVAKVRARFPRARVIVSSAHIAATRGAAPILGADVVLPKPFDVNALTSTVDSLLAADRSEPARPYLRHEEPPQAGLRDPRDPRRPGA